MRNEARNARIGFRLAWVCFGLALIYHTDRLAVGGLSSDGRVWTIVAIFIAALMMALSSYGLGRNHE